MYGGHTVQMKEHGVHVLQTNAPIWQSTPLVMLGSSLTTAGLSSLATFLHARTFRLEVPVQLWLGSNGFKIRCLGF